MPTFRRIEKHDFSILREALPETFITKTSLTTFLPLTKQHDYLLTNTLCTIKRNLKFLFKILNCLKIGEIGGQVDLFYTLKKKTSLGGKYGTKIALNMSYWAGLSGEYDYLNFEYDSDLLSFGEKYFSDISLEIRKKWV